MVAAWIAWKTRNNALRSLRRAQVCLCKRARATVCATCIHPAICRPAPRLSEYPDAGVRCVVCCTYGSWIRTHGHLRHCTLRFFTPAATTREWSERGSRADVCGFGGIDRHAQPKIEHEARGVRPKAGTSRAHSVVLGSSAGQTGPTFLLSADLPRGCALATIVAVIALVAMLHGPIMMALPITTAFGFPAVLLAASCGINTPVARAAGLSSQRK